MHHAFEVLMGPEKRVRHAEDIASGSPDGLVVSTLANSNNELPK